MYNKKIENKANINKIYPKFIEEIGKVLDYGDNKYGLMNWKKYENINELTSALMRHSNQFNSGDMFDEESGYSHLSHIASNCMMLMWLIDNGVVKMEDLYHYGYNHIYDDSKDKYKNFSGADMNRLIYIARKQLKELGEENKYIKRSK